jgi:hypothetical protein
MKPIMSILDYLADVTVEIARIIMASAALVFVLANIHHADNTTYALNMWQSIILVTITKVVLDTVVGILRMSLNSNRTETKK